MCHHARYNWGIAIFFGCVKYDTVDKPMFLFYLCTVKESIQHNVLRFTSLRFSFDVRYLCLNQFVYEVENKFEFRLTEVVFIMAKFEYLIRLNVNTNDDVAPIYLIYLQKLYSKNNFISLSRITIKCYTNHSVYQHLVDFNQ